MAESFNPFTDEECEANVKNFISPTYDNVGEIPYAEYQAFLTEKGFDENRVGRCLTNYGKKVGMPPDKTPEGPLDPSQIPSPSQIGVETGPTENTENSITTVGEYQIQKADNLKGKLSGATDAYRVAKGDNQYVVFRGLNMTGGRKNSKSQKRGGKKQRQTKKRGGSRHRRSNRRR